jgi:hypothetical protein
MKHNNRSKFLRLKSRLYVKLLVFLGMLSFSMLWGCGNNNDGKKDQQRIDDSIATINHKQDSLMRQKADSTALAEEKKAKLDSIAKADSIFRAYDRHNLNRPKYGVPVNYGPNDGAKKYGVRRVDND